MANGAPTVSNGLVISGVTTVTTLDLNGDLDVDGHLNADNVSIAGVCTATSFVGSLSGGSVSGTSGAFTGNIDLNSDTNKLKIGAGDDFQFFHNGSNNFIETNNGDIRIKTSDSSGNLTFTAGGSTERFRIDSDGRLLVGHTSARVISTTVNPHLQLEGTTFHQSAISVTRNTNDAYGSYLILGKSRATSNGGNVILQDNDIISELRFAGSDGNDMVNIAAQIRIEVDGTPQTDQMPGAMIFSTNSGGASATERLRIQSNGAFYIKSPDSSTGDQPGELQWWNENGAGVMAKIVAYREGSNYAPSGIKFYTTQNVDTSANNSQGDITERFFINSEGKFYKGGNHFYPLVQIYEARVSGAVSNTGTGSYQDIKNVATYTPKKVGNRVHVHLQCQTWNASQTDGSSDAYARLQHNNGGSYTTFTECDRVQGNFAMDERYRHAPFTMDGWFTATTTNSTTIKFQGNQGGSLPVAFNWFHAYGGSITIMEYDIT